VHAYEQALRSMTAPSSSLDDRLRAIYGRLHVQAIKVAILLAALDWADSGDLTPQPTNQSILPKQKRAVRMLCACPTVWLGRAQTRQSVWIFCPAASCMLARFSCIIYPIDRSQHRRKTRMSKLNLKPTSKPIRQYFEVMQEKKQRGFEVEGNIAPAFANLLGLCAKELGYHLNEQHQKKVNGRLLKFDAAILTQYNLCYGVWEAKDTKDDLKVEIRKKFEAGYPNDNILFQSPQQAILIQDGREVLNVPLNDAQNLIDVLNAFFSYSRPAYDEWEQAVAEFKDRVPEVAQGLDERIEKEYTRNGGYKDAFDKFLVLCRQAINPNLSKDAVEEMLIQHILTERIFRRVFQNDKFTRQNAIAREIETVVDALTSRQFSRDDFTRELDHFYGAIESTAQTISEYNEKQDFLNTVYEQFFQGFSVKVADTHGIVYTPQAIVQFMVRSVEDLLQREFGRSLADIGVHILDPFVGTGNFILRVMEEIRTIKPSALAQKYASELHCNEIMLLPYYIASMNIEHAYYEAQGEYQPFEGICLVDTFELAEARQMALLTEANSKRVEQQRCRKLTVILGNPPYNMGQVNENDNNKNRTYDVLDKRVQETYVRDSKATLRNKLSDPYVKAFRWASDRLKDEGVIAFVTNNSFLDAIAFDGMRHWLAQEFSAIYHLDFKGNARTSGERRRREGGNIFSDLIRVGVGITFLVKRKDHQAPAKIYLYRVGDYLKAGQKLAALENKMLVDMPMKQIEAQANLWLTEGMQDDYEGLLPMGTKEAKAGRGNAIFELYSLGVVTSRDQYVYDFRKDDLRTRTRQFIEIYNQAVDVARRPGNTDEVETLIDVSDQRIKWSRQVKQSLKKREYSTFQEQLMRDSLYRPFTKMHYYFDDFWTEERYQQPVFFPTPETERENRVICLSNIGNTKPFHCLMSNVIPDYHLTGDSQCFPLYVYEDVGDGGQGGLQGAFTNLTLNQDDLTLNQDDLTLNPSPLHGEGLESTTPGGLRRRENISDWALEQFRAHYGDASIRKEDIFYYIYALLHHAGYREKYAANLKRELPRIPFAGDFQHFARIGRALADLHLGYESAPEYALERIENAKVPVSYRVEKMKLSKDKSSLQVNEFLTLAGIPAEAYGYLLGNRSALEWVIDQYQVKTDTRSDIRNDPNRLDDEQYIVRLVGQVVHVSVETVRLVQELEAFSPEESTH
jgi:predicted helicase